MRSWILRLSFRTIALKQKVRRFRRAFFCVRPAERTQLEVKVLYTLGKGTFPFAPLRVRDENGFALIPSLRIEIRGTQR